jgi:hypothetical protein
VSGQRRNERLVSDVRSESFGMLGRPEGQDFQVQRNP